MPNGRGHPLPRLILALASLFFIPGASLPRTGRAAGLVHLPAERGLLNTNAGVEAESHYAAHAVKKLASLTTDR